MKLLTKEILKKLPPLYSNENKDPKKVQIIVKFFNPYGAGTWYATEYDPKQRLFFGFAEIHPGFGELGNFSLDELESIKVKPLGLGIERDMYFGKHYLKEVVDGKRP